MEKKHHNNRANSVSAKAVLIYNGFL